MPDEKDDKHLDINYSERRYKTREGFNRVEVSADAIWKAEGKKENIRKDPTDRADDARLRRQARQPGMQSTHLQPAEQGAKPHKDNVTPFNPTMNQREIRAQEMNTEEVRGKGHDVNTKISAIHRADLDGNKEARPIAIKYDREWNSADGKKSDSTYYGNFSSRRERLAQDKEAAGQKPTKAERKEATAADNALYDRNRSIEPDPDQQKLWRQKQKDQIREQSRGTQSPEKEPSKDH